MREHRYNQNDRRRQNGSLSDLLDRCGHYFAHRIGASHRGQDSVLLCLAQHPGATQKELTELLGITPASLSEVLMKLERKGHIERAKDENDRRFSRVHLTAEGEAALESPENRADPFSSLSQQEQEILKELLTKLLCDWEGRMETTRHRREGRGREHGVHGDEHPGHGDEHPGHGYTRRGERNTHREHE